MSFAISSQSLVVFSSAALGFTLTAFALFASSSRGVGPVNTPQMAKNASPPEVDRTQPGKYETATFGMG